ncbi:hypothetical protein ACSBPH_01640 [Microbacterium sp. F51-2R]|jgi:hypothetical protein
MTIDPIRDHIRAEFYRAVKDSANALTIFALTITIVILAWILKGRR